MSLASYRQKRNFHQTPEPAGTVARKPGWSYVVQKHAASHLHYDFRLEWQGVLKSWAVPKGPSLDPSVKRLAIQVEDHPVAYGSFEGIIPADEYGGGTVMVWDQGTWEPVGDAAEGFRTGKLKFRLQGSKLRGGWMLVRSLRRQAGDKPQWLLIKERDEEASARSEDDVLTRQPASAVSGRSLDEIAAAADSRWTSTSSHRSKSGSGNSKSGRKLATGTRSTRQQSAGEQDQLASETPASRNGKSSSRAKKKKSRPDTLPDFVPPQLATLVNEPPEGGDWVHEVKFDGYRMLARIEGGDVKFLTRNREDWTHRVPTLAAALRNLPAQQALLDGEVVVLDPDGVSDFQALQNAFRDAAADSLCYYVFDLLHLNGVDLTSRPLVFRKQALAELLGNHSQGGPVRYSDYVSGQGAEFAERACHLHLEGMISKRKDRPYISGRGTDWLKFKCLQTEEFVICGFTDPSGAREGFGALLLGYLDDEQQLKYAGKVGTGFDHQSLRELKQRFEKLKRKTSPFPQVERRARKIPVAHWVTPELVAQIRYGSRTRDGLLRHAAYLGLREDKPAAEVHLDVPLPIETAQALETAETRENSSAPKTSRVSAQSSRKRLSATRTDERGGATSTGQRKTSADLKAVQETEVLAGVRFTSPDKVLESDSDTTKLDLARYYENVADWILPHLQHRPLVVVRCPEGQFAACFYQKHPGQGTPPELRQITVREQKGSHRYLVIDDVQGLIALTQMSVLELHAWGSREDRLERPDLLIFDLDPDTDVAWKDVVQAAGQVRQFLDQLGLQSFLKTTGGKGLHLVVPIQRRHDWDEAREFCQNVARAISTADPQRFTSTLSKSARKQKIFIDYLRNGRGATAVVPYSTRARPGLPVSMPLAWEELSADVHSDSWTIRNAYQRLSGLSRNPWADLFTVRQTLAGPIRKLGKLFRQ